MRNIISKYFHCFELFLDSAKVKTSPSRQFQLQYCIQKLSGCKTKTDQNSFIKTTYTFSSQFSFQNQSNKKKRKLGN